MKKFEKGEQSNGDNTILLKKNIKKYYNIDTKEELEERYRMIISAIFELGAY